MLKNQAAKPTNTSQNRKLPARYTPVVFAFFMSAIMALLMCLVITAASIGLHDDYFVKVMHAYALAMPVAFICVLAVRPIVIKLVALCVRN